MESPEVTVVVVAYNSADCIGDCIASVRRQRGVALEIVIVDNASRDDTVDKVRALGPGIRLLANRDNVGFGRGCNAGAVAGTGRFVHLLNPDAILVGDDALRRLGSDLDAKPQWGAAATRVLSAAGHDESIPATTYPGQARARNDFDRLPGKIAWVIGASLFIRREVFEELGGFDPDFFLYSEETDLCLRMRRAGHEIGFVPEVSVRHIGGASERGRDPYDMWTRKMKGMHLFWRKHYSQDDALRLVRRDLLRARWRARLNGILARFQPEHSAAWEKQRRYSAIRDVSAAFVRDG